MVTLMLCSKVSILVFRKKNQPRKCLTTRAGIIEPYARTLELPLPVRSGSFFFPIGLTQGLRNSIFSMRSTPCRREEISDVFARGPIIPVLKVSYDGPFYHSPAPSEESHAA